MALHHNEFVSEVFENLSDSNWIVSNVPCSTQSAISLQKLRGGNTSTFHGDR